MRVIFSPLNPGWVYIDDVSVDEYERVVAACGDARISCHVVNDTAVHASTSTMGWLRIPEPAGAMIQLWNESAGLWEIPLAEYLKTAFPEGLHQPPDVAVAPPEGAPRRTS